MGQVALHGQPARLPIVPQCQNQVAGFFSQEGNGSNPIQPHIYGHLSNQLLSSKATFYLSDSRVLFLNHGRKKRTVKRGPSILYSLQTIIHKWFWKPQAGDGCSVSDFCGFILPDNRNFPCICLFSWLDCRSLKTWTVYYSYLYPQKLGYSWDQLHGLWSVLSQWALNLVLSSMLPSWPS